MCFRCIAGRIFEDGKSEFGEKQLLRDNAQAADLICHQSVKSPGPFVYLPASPKSACVGRLQLVPAIIRIDVLSDLG
jgi:hypothetical protein